MICKVKADKQPRQTALAVVRAKGQSVRLELPRGLVLRVLVDEIRPEGAGLLITADPLGLVLPEKTPGAMIVEVDR